LKIDFFILGFKHQNEIDGGLTIEQTDDSEALLQVNDSEALLQVFHTSLCGKLPRPSQLKSNKSSESKQKMDHLFE
jgi:hypothetical protein